MKLTAKILPFKREPTLEDLIGGHVLDVRVGHVDPAVLAALERDMLEQLAERKRDEERDGK